MKTTFLSLAWSVSRGQNTYGYNIAKLTDTETQKAFKTCGGGYDMIGTVFADWLEANFQTELLAFANNAHYVFDGKKTTSSNKPAYCPHYGDKLENCSLYGMTFYTEEHRVSLDGACGLDSIKRIAQALNLEVKQVLNKKCQIIGFNVSTKEVQA